jgi:hypothetical protein
VLASRGHRTVDADADEWSEQVPLPDGCGVEQRWREAPMRRLLAESGARCLFVSGCVSNQVRFYDKFAAVVLLSAPGQVMLDRIARRPTNPFGKNRAKRHRILADLEAVQPLLRRSATVEIATDRPLAEGVAALRQSGDERRRGGPVPASRQGCAECPSRPAERSDCFNRAS